MMGYDLYKPGQHMAYSGTTLKYGYKCFESRLKVNAHQPLLMLELPQLESLD